MLRTVPLGTFIVASNSLVLPHCGKRAASILACILSEALDVVAYAPVGPAFPPYTRYSITSSVVMKVLYLPSLKVSIT